MNKLSFAIASVLLILSMPAKAEDCKIANDYIGSILKKLVVASSKVAGLKTRPINLEIDCWKHGDLAMYGGNQITYSSSFAVKLKYEDEIAFILAHELSHAFRDHHMGSDIINFENEADSYALSIMAAASYQPSFSISSVVKGMLRHVDNDGNPYYLVHKDDAHLPLPTRIARLAQLIQTKKLISNREGKEISEETMAGMTNELMDDE